MFTILNETIFNEIIARNKKQQKPSFETLLAALDVPMTRQAPKEEPKYDVEFDVEITVSKTKANTPKKEPKRINRPIFLGDGVVLIGFNAYRVKVDIFGDHYITVNDVNYYIEEDKDGKYLVRE